MPRYLLLLLLLWSGALCAHAQQSGSTTQKSIVARRIVGVAPSVDGRLDDGAWTQAAFVTDFRQKDPVEGGAPSERTELAILYDDDAFFIGARMHRADPSLIHNQITRRDAVGNTERIIISLDTYHDRRTASSFVVTAAGGRADYYHPDDNEFSRDYSFDPVWEGDAAIDALGWTAELRIPFSQLRFNDESTQTWGMNVNRWLPDRNEDIYWVVVPKNVNGWSSRMGEIVGLSGVHPSLRLELLPYIAGEGRFPDSIDGGNPFDHRWSGRAGLDLKMGIGPNLTLDATVNPDFGQVEADPAQVNLSDFESFFDERRPFFIEGGQLLRGGGAGYFYSRRIGAPPRSGVGADYVDVADNTTILAATKLTGRMSSGLSIGGLAAVTEREYARSYDKLSREYDTVAVDPTTLFGVVRLQQEFGEDQSTIGFTATAVNRQLQDTDTVLRSLLSDRAYTGGIDYGLRFDGGTWDLSGYLGGSTVHGDSSAIYRLQRSSARYFQRPDADYVEIDRSRESLTGYTFGSTLSRNAGSWRGYFGVGLESPEFELNDIGRLGTADDIDVWGGLSYYESIPSDVFRSYNVNLNVSRGWNYGGVNTYQSLDVESNFELKNYWSMSVWSGVNLPARSDGLSRGGPLMGLPLSGHVGAWISTPGTADVKGSLAIDYSTNSIGTRYYGIDPSISASIGDQWSIQLNASFSQNRTPRQHVQTLIGGNDATYGRRYVFARIFQTSASSQLRVSYVITPQLSLDFYAEPFASAGEYYDYGELPEPGTVDIRRYQSSGGSYRREGPSSIAIVDRGSEFTVDRDDFTYLSFRSNLVLRWEWLRGSTAYFVWQRDAGTYTGEPEEITMGHLWDAITSSGSQVFALKVAYWFPVD